MPVDRALNPPTLVPLDDDLNPPTIEPLRDELNPPTLAPLDDDVRTARSVPTARKLPTAPLLRGPKEVAWSGDAPPPTAKLASAPANLDGEEPFIRRRRRKGLPKLLLAGVAIALLGTLAVAGIGLYRHYVLTESQLAQKAEDAYKDGNYPAAQQKYEELLTRFGGSSDAEKYRFFADLSGTRAVVGSVTARENPAPAMKAFAAFVEQHGQSSYAQPESGFGADVVQAGRRLAETVADHAGDRLKSFLGDRKKLDDLTAAERAVQDGRDLLPTIDKFRDRQDDNLATVRGRIDEMEKSFKFERHRLEVLAPFRDLPTDPKITSERIGSFQVALKDNKLTDDAEALQMLAAAEKWLQENVKYASISRPAVAAPVDPLRPVLFAAPVAGSREPRPAPGVTPDAVFAVAPRHPVRAGRRDRPAPVGRPRGVADRRPADGGPADPGVRERRGRGRLGAGRR